MMLVIYSHDTHASVPFVPEIKQSLLCPRNFACATPSLSHPLPLSLSNNAHPLFQLKCHLSVGA